MKRKPSGAKYRNLTARGGVIYYQRDVGGRRVRFSCQTDDWEVAASVRDPVCVHFGRRPLRL